MTKKQLEQKIKKAFAYHKDTDALIVTERKTGISFCHKLKTSPLIMPVKKASNGLK